MIQLLVVLAVIFLVIVLAPILVPVGLVGVGGVAAILINYWYWILGAIAGCWVLMEFFGRAAQRSREREAQARRAEKKRQHDEQQERSIQASKRYWEQKAEMGEISREEATEITSRARGISERHN